MLKRIAPIIAVLAIAVFAAVKIPAATDGVTDANDSKAMTVHEWGTFTSVAGKNGEAVAWLPYENLSAQSDLPCFVYQSQPGIKATLMGTVRMETPVLYFYALKEMNVDATVRFSKGWITEWYPQAKFTNHDFLFEPDKDSVLEWSGVRIHPGATPDLPVEPGPSHYYAARQTDAAPLQINNQNENQNEKFLFYRGVGNFQVPITAEVEGDGKILIQNVGKDPIPSVILFENRGGSIGYRAQGALTNAIALDPPNLTDDFASLKEELERTLVSAGLYPKEAAAMVATWRDSWFEEGTRVFYIVPPKTVDAILPLQINPKPDTVSRVFIGRMEVITPSTKETIIDAIRTGNQTVLNTYARFLRPIAEQSLAMNTSLEVKNVLQNYALTAPNALSNSIDKFNASSLRCK